jgi:tRNA pseudouridine38-40 synthase
LPADIVVRSIEPVEEAFHARFSARSRRYEYYIWNAPLANLFRRQYVWWVRNRLDVVLMEEAGTVLLGRHDFSSFQGSDHEKVFPEREVLEIGFRTAGPEIVFFIHANGFLRHMVRNIVGTLVDVGKGKRTKDDVIGILEARDRAEAGITAPAQGLFLTEVLY